MIAGMPPRPFEGPVHACALNISTRAAVVSHRTLQYQRENNRPIRNEYPELTT